MNSKKKISLLLASMLLLSPLAVSEKAFAAPNSSTIIKDGDSEVIILDETLERRILQTLNKAYDDSITIKDLESITSLDLSIHVNDLHYVKDLKELQYCTNLKSLNMKGLNLKDFSPIANLSSLTDLDVSDTNFSDVSILKALPNLTSLKLSSADKFDYSALKDLTNLTSLDLNDNKLTDISMLKSLTKLTSLNLGHNSITDTETISTLTNLTSLDISDTKISDLSFLKNLKKLTDLSLARLNTDNLSVISDMKNLTSLDLDYNKNVDPSVLYNLTNLKTLNLRSTKISDISFLKDFKDLTSLSLTESGVTDISPLEKLTSLTKLVLYNNNISDISVLSYLTNLEYLDLSKNSITDVSPLTLSRKLNMLILGDNKISDVTPLKILTNLKQLLLNGNCITNIYPLLNLSKNLIYINLQNQKINLNIDDADEFKKFSIYDCLNFYEMHNDGLIDEEHGNFNIYSSSKKDSVTKSYSFSLPLKCFHIADPCVMSTNYYSGDVTVHYDELYNAVTIPDENLKSAILDTLNKDKDYTIKKKDLESLTSLDCMYKGIKDLSGIEYCTNLKELHLEANNISDLSPLNKLQDKVENLFITGQRITLPSKKCNSLITIQNPITGYDKKPIKPYSISNNGTYNEADNTITWDNLAEDTDSLKIDYYDGEAAYYKKLEEASSVPIPGIPTGYSCTVTLPVDVSVKDSDSVNIKDKKLKAAIFSALNITDSTYELSKTDMESITTLNLANKGIKDISGLESCTNLKTINLNNNKISDIKPLTKLKNLEKADLAGNKITDITCLYGITDSMPVFNITKQYIVLSPGNCQGNLQLTNMIKDMPEAVPTKISNGGTYTKHFGIIDWRNLNKNTTVSYSYEKALSEEEAKDFSAPLFNYSCTVNKYIKVSAK